MLCVLNKRFDLLFYFAISTHICFLQLLSVSLSVLLRCVVVRAIRCSMFNVHIIMLGVEASEKEPKLATKSAATLTPRKLSVGQHPMGHSATTIRTTKAISNVSLLNKSVPILKDFPSLHKERYATERKDSLGVGYLYFVFISLLSLLKLFSFPTWVTVTFL